MSERAGSESLEGSRRRSLASTLKLLRKSMRERDQGSTCSSLDNSASSPKIASLLESTGLSKRDLVPPIPRPKVEEGERIARTALRKRTSQFGLSSDDMPEGQGDDTQPDGISLMPVSR